MLLHLAVLQTLAERQAIEDFLSAVYLAQRSLIRCADDASTLVLLYIAVLQALAERQAIEDFLSAGAALLALQASSVEEIGRAGQEARGLVARLAEVPQVR
jgi:hypothetical protein